MAWCCAQPVARTFDAPTQRRGRRVTIVAYEVVDASHDTARDGAVSVVTDSDADVLQVMWTTGAVVDSCDLANVRPGLYAACVLYADGMPVDCVHTCAPARVQVRNAA